MGRTTLSQQRLVEIKKTNIGKLIIFCEGNTEKYYFEYFSEILNEEKYNNVMVKVESANGNAQAVLNFAQRFLAEEENNRTFGLYEKYLVFDCDAPQNIETVISNAKNFELLVSNYLFETWLLMHFMEIEKQLTKKEIYRLLTDHLNRGYKKARKGIIREILHIGNVEYAINQAYLLEKKYFEDGKNIFKHIKEMNPFTSVHRLVEKLMFEISV